MCKALEDLYNDGIECGIEQGIERGSIAGCKRVNRLNCILAEKKRIDDIIRASVDMEYQQKLFEEFAFAYGHFPRPSGPRSPARQGHIKRPVLRLAEPSFLRPANQCC